MDLKLLLLIVIVTIVTKISQQDQTEHLELRMSWSRNLQDHQPEVENPQSRTPKFQSEKLPKSLRRPEVKSFMDFFKRSANSTRKAPVYDIYTFGGWADDHTCLSSASRLNSRTGSWESLMSPMSVARGVMCGTVIDNKVYLFGGFTGKDTFFDTAEEYDSSKNTYRKLKPLPEARAGCGAAVVNGMIYVAGGGRHDDPADWSSVLRYDPKTDQWSGVKPMSSKRFGLQLVELNGSLYAISGTYDNQRMEVYNVATDQWSFGAKTNYYHEFFGAAVLNGKIYIGGKGQFEVYSPDTEKWTMFKSPNDYIAESLVSANGKLWAIGGSLENTKLSMNSFKSVFSYDTSTGNWTEEADMDVARGGQSSFAVRV